uniref:Uncharacterized protein n=1 Tax=Fagus sylvatica TaxID=28930 RepID=A0A2N9E3U8_FAGSY
MPDPMANLILAIDPTHHLPYLPPSSILLPRPGLTVAIRTESLDSKHNHAFREPKESNGYDHDHYEVPVELGDSNQVMN